MPAGVEQHVRERCPYLARGSQRVQMEPLREHPPAATEHPVHCPHDACADGHHAACERAGVVRLHDQVGMRVLKRVMDEAEVASLARFGKAALDRAYDGHGAERRRASEKSDRCTGGKARGHASPRPVRNRRGRARLPPCAGTTTAPTVVRTKREGALE